MYGLFAREFAEEHDRKQGFLAYQYLIETDKDLENARNYIRKFPNGADIVEEVLDRCIESLLNNDYNIEKAINHEVGGVKSIKNFIHDQLGYAYKRIRAEKKQLREKHGIVEQSLYAPVEGHMSKSEGEAYVEDYVADENATFGEVRLSIKETVGKLIKIDQTVYSGLIVLVVLRECDSRAKESALKILGVDMPTRRDATSEEVFDVIQDLVHFEVEDIIKELHRQTADAAQYEQLLYQSLGAANG